MEDAQVRLDRYIAGELSRPDERALAERALDDPDLFDALMVAGAARTALLLENAAERPDASPTRGRIVLGVFRKPVVAALTAAAAAAIGFFVVYPIARTSRRPAEPPASSRTSQAAAATNAVSPAVSRPVLLAARLEDLGGVPQFRSESPASRSPQSEGRILSQQDEGAVIALGLWTE